MSGSRSTSNNIFFASQYTSKQFKLFLAIACIFLVQLLTSCSLDNTFVFSNSGKPVRVKSSSSQEVEVVDTNSNTECPQLKFDERGASYHGAVLVSSNFSNHDLQGADFSNANLRGADFKCANLSGADFSNADLRGANLTNAKIDGANWENAKLNGIKNNNT